MTFFQARLNELFRESGKTQEEFGKAIGVSRQTLSTYLSGKNIPDAETIRNICVRFYVSADWLLGLSSVKTPDPDFQKACNTFGLSEAAGKTLLDYHGDELNTLLGFGDGFWTEFLMVFSYLLQYKDEMQSGDCSYLIEPHDDHLILNAHAAADYCVASLGQMVSRKLHTWVAKDAKKEEENGEP